MSIHPCIECDDEVRPRQQTLQCDDYGRSYDLSDHMIDFCVATLINIELPDRIILVLWRLETKFTKATSTPVAQMRSILLIRAVIVTFSLYNRLFL